MTQTEFPTVTSSCPRCGVTFDQPRDPGRRRKFCSSACRQADYRARNRKDGHEAQRQRKAQEEARRQHDRERARERRAREAREQAARAGASWTAPRHTDTPAEAKARATCRKLMDRATHARTNGHEATACREKADTIRAKYSL